MAAETTTGTTAATAAEQHPQDGQLRPLAEELITMLAEDAAAAPWRTARTSSNRLSGGG